MTSILSSPRLKFALVADAVAAAAVAVLHGTLAAHMAKWLSLPPAWLLGTAAFMLPWAVLLLLLARMQRMPKWLVMLVIDVNLLWAMGALLLSLTNARATHFLGHAYLLLNVALVLVFAGLQWRGLRVSQPATCGQVLRA